MTCDMLEEDLARHAAGECDPGRAREIEAHLARCPQCQRRLRSIRKVDESLGILPPLAPPATTILSLRRAIAEAIGARPAPEIMTLEDVAGLLRISPGDMEEFAEDLPAFEIAGHVRVRRARLIEWIEQRERQYERGPAGPILPGKFGKGVA